MAWSWSPAFDKTLPAKWGQWDILSCWVTWFIRICKIFIRASIEKSPGDCNILQIGRAVVRQAELICRKLSSQDKKTWNISWQFQLKAFLPFSFITGAWDVLPHTGKHDAPWKISFSDNMFMCMSVIDRIIAFQLRTYLDIQWGRMEHLWQHTSVCHAPLHMLFPPVSMWLSSRRICETLCSKGDSWCWKWDRSNLP